MPSSGYKYCKRIVDISTQQKENILFDIGFTQVVLGRARYRLLMGNHVVRIAHICWFIIIISLSNHHTMFKQHSILMLQSNMLFSCTTLVLFFQCIQYCQLLYQVINFASICLNSKPKQDYPSNHSASMLIYLYINEIVTLDLFYPLSYLGKCGNYETKVLSSSSKRDPQLITIYNVKFLT